MVNNISHEMDVDKSEFLVPIIYKTELQYLLKLGLVNPT